MCYHIVRWLDSVRAIPAIERCFRSRQQAHQARTKGITGDRSEFHLAPHNPDNGMILEVVQCPAGESCACRGWRTGCCRDSIAPRVAWLVFMCDDCKKGRRPGWRIIDPETETTLHLCNRCEKKWRAKDYLRVARELDRGRIPSIPRRVQVHADNEDMASVVYATPKR